MAGGPSLPWLVRLRWFFSGAQLCALLAGERLTDLEVSWNAVIPVLILGAGSNLALSRWTDQSHPTAMMGTALSVDAVLLSGILAASGASSNPFTVMYLVLIVLAAVVLDARWTTTITVLCASCFALLFSIPIAEASHPGSHHDFGGHLRSMWVAFTVAAVIVAYFVRKIVLIRETQQQQILALRAQSERSAHLAALTTLSAGAAHELRTPLGTIALAAGELMRSSAAAKAHPGTQQDLQLILEEVDRAQRILQQMGLRFTERAQETEVDVGQLVQQVVREIDDPRVELLPQATAVTIRATQLELTTALTGLIRNALDAIETQGTRVTVSTEVEPGYLQLVVSDDGPQVPQATLSRAVEPFFTTKEPGFGMGLGLFLVQAHALRVGGTFSLDRLSRATVARLKLPWSAGGSA